jgi:hypothetical protein
VDSAASSTFINVVSLAVAFIFGSLSIIISVVSIIISVVSLVVAFMIPFYMLTWKKPYVKVSFVGDGGSISIEIQNVPHESGLRKRFFGERNSIQKLTTAIIITEVQENGFELYDYQGDLKFGHEKFEHEEIILPASVLTAKILIAGVFADIRRNKATLFHELQTPELPEGRYCLDISVCADNELMAERKDFVVRTDDGKNTIVQWVEENAKAKK